MLCFFHDYHHPKAVRWPRHLVELMKSWSCNYLFLVVYIGGAFRSLIRCPDSLPNLILLDDTMRLLASRLSTFLCRRRPGYVQYRNFSSSDAEGGFFSSSDAKGGFFSSNDAEGDEPIKLEDEPSIAMALLKSLSWGDMIGAHMLTLHATDDERRMKIVEIGGAQGLVNMLRDAIDYDRELLALKAIAALSVSEEAVGALHRAGAIPVIKFTKPKVESIRENLQVDEIEEYKSSLLKRFHDLGYDILSPKRRAYRKR